MHLDGMMRFNAFVLALAVATSSVEAEIYLKEQFTDDVSGERDARARKMERPRNSHAPGLHSLLPR
jgi:hypothetical protein